ncbi:MAG: metallophosphoesterase [Polyangiaceae bacterium]
MAPLHHVAHTQPRDHAPLARRPTERSRSMIVAAFFGLFIGLSVVFAVRKLHPTWWQLRAVRVALAVLIACPPIGILSRALGTGRLVTGFSSATLGILGATLGGGAILTLALFFTVPIAGLVRFVAARALRVSRGAPTTQASALEAPAAEAPAPEAPAPEASTTEAPAPEAPAHKTPAPLPLTRRRVILEVAAASLPLTALGMGAAGIAGAFARTHLAERRMRFAGLPAGLEGLRILQITDLHLGAFRDLDSLPELVETCADARADLVVVTGDFCDHLPWLAEGLNHVKRIQAPLGTFAVFGNHEHYRGALKNRAGYDRAGIPLLLDKHAVLERGGARLLLAGVDDPSGWDHTSEHYERHADAALDGAPSDLFSVALSHRPSGFDALAARGMHLTLSGHTHGAQMGFAGRSALEPVLPNMHLWGAYTRGASQLYTSSGAGHWAAFRLACPSELPLVILERA